MKFHLSLPRLNSSRKARSKALTFSVAVGVITFVLATFGGKLTMGKVTSVVVAANDLQPGQVITASDLKDAGKMSGTLPPDAITSKNDVIGLSLAYPVKAGQPMIKGLVSDTPMRNGLYPSEVGVWVPVSLTTSGLVKPGDVVDVYLTPDSNGNNWGKSIPSQMITSLQGVRVVAAVNNSAQSVQSNANNPNGNVPVAVELAIPKNSANSFSQFATGKVSLMLDPFATQTTTNSVQISAATTNSPVSTTTPSASVQNSVTATQPSGANTQQPGSAPMGNSPNTQTPTQTPAQGQPNNQVPSNSVTNPNAGTAPNPTSNTGSTNAGEYNPPIYNPAAK